MISFFFLNTITYVLTKFSKTRTNSFRVLQELISTLVNTTLLIKTIIFNILFFCCHSFLTYFFTSQGLCGEVIGTIVKTTLNQVTVKLHEILHLHAHSFRYQLMYVSFSSCFFFISLPACAQSWQQFELVQLG